MLESLVKIGQMIEQQIEVALQPCGLSVPKLTALHFLEHSDEPLPLGALSEKMHCVRSNITQLMDRLEADKLVQRVADSEDRRSVRAVITEEGRKRYEVGRQAVAEAQHHILDALPEEKRATLSNMLGLLLAGDAQQGSKL